MLAVLIERQNRPIRLKDKQSWPFMRCGRHLTNELIFFKVELEKKLAKIGSYDMRRQVH